MRLTHKFTNKETVSHSQLTRSKSAGYSDTINLNWLLNANLLDRWTNGLFVVLTLSAERHRQPTRYHKGHIDSVLQNR